MPHFIYDNITLPADKLNLTALPSAADPNKYETGSDWNSLKDAADDLRDQTTNGRYIGWGDGTLADVSASSKSRVRNLAGVLQSSTNARQYRPMMRDLHGKEYGVKADGTTDDYAAVQATLNAAKVLIDAQIPVLITWPPGRMRLTQTPVMYGNSAMAPSMRGERERGDNYSTTGSSIFWWDGSSLGTVFFTQGINVCRISDIMFDGNSKAKYAFEYSATTHADRAILAASNDVIFERCVFQFVKVGTVGTGCFAAGTDTSLTGGDTFEAAAGLFKSCLFRGEDPGASGFSYAAMKAFGWRNMSGGNAKIFRFEDCSWLWCNIALDNDLASSQVVVTNYQMGDVRQCFRHGAGELLASGGDCEASHVDDCRLITGTAQAGSYAKIEGMEYVPYMAGAVGTAVEFGGYLHLQGCYLRNANYSVSADPDVPNPFKLIVSSSFGSTQGSLRSKANFYYSCGSGTDNFIPAYDGSANPLWPTLDTYGADHALAISSEDDLGGVGASPVKLGAFNSDARTLYSARFNGPTAFMQLASGTTGTLTVADQAQVYTMAPSSNMIAQLPTAVGIRGRWYTFKKFNANASTITVTPNGAETIDGAATLVLAAPYSSVTVWSNGANWLAEGQQFAVTDADFQVTGKLGVGGAPSYNFHVQGAAVGGALGSFSGASSAVSDIILYVTGGTKTGDWSNFVQFTAALNGTLSGKHENSDSTHSGAHAQWAINAGGASGGDPTVKWGIPSAQDWCAGIDNSDSDAWKIAASSVLGNASFDVLRVTVAGDASLPLGKLGFGSTDSSGTPGAATINKASGRSAIAATASSVVVTNSKVSGASQKVGFSIVSGPDVAAPILAPTATGGSFTMKSFNTSGVQTVATANIIFDWWLFD